MRRGTEVITHATRAFLREHGESPNYGVLQLDLVNVFNLISRNEFRRLVSNISKPSCPGSNISMVEVRDQSYGRARITTSEARMVCNKVNHWAPFYSHSRYNPSFTEYAESLDISNRTRPVTQCYWDSTWTTGCLWLAMKYLPKCSGTYLRQIFARRAYTSNAVARKCGGRPHPHQRSDFSMHHPPSHQNNTNPNSKLNSSRSHSTTPMALPY